MTGWRGGGTLTDGMYPSSVLYCAVHHLVLPPPRASDRQTGESSRMHKSYCRHAWQGKVLASMGGNRRIRAGDGLSCPQGTVQ